MKEHVGRRARNTALSPSRALQPLYEAVANGIQEIHEAKRDGGEVRITVHRETNLVTGENPEEGAFTAFHVQDNGAGFTAENFDAFSTADTDHKSHLGSRGVGRFLWLVAFSRVEITSTYQDDNDQWKVRRFDFISTADGIANPTCEDTTAHEPSTCVKLLGFQTKFQRQCPKSTEKLASQLVEHFLGYFIRNDCPTLYLDDPSCGRSICLNEYFDSHILTISVREPVRINGFDITILHVRLLDSPQRQHCVHYCADSRSVRCESLVGKIPDLIPGVTDDAGNAFTYHAYVDGQVLQDNLNGERTDFTFDESGSGMFDDDLDWKTIRSGIYPPIQRFLSPFTEHVRAKKADRIDAFISETAPMFRPVIKYAGGMLDHVNPDIDDAALDAKLYQVYQQVQTDLRKEGHDIAKLQCSDHDWEAHQEKVQAYFQRASDLNRSDLARYVCHRRAVLDFVNARLAIQENGRYHAEELIHRLIYPMGNTSSEIDADAHNLWIVDERLVYHRFLASDKTLRSSEVGTSTKEPDILVLDRAMAFVTGTSGSYDSCHIIEFKRPMRKDYSDKENPFHQLSEYIDDIRAGKATTPHGRPMDVHTDAKFFCYVVCDLTPNLRRWARMADLQASPDEQGYFGFHRAIRVYFEVVSFNKLLNDAAKRNAAFFEKLNLPPVLLK